MAGGTGSGTTPIRSRRQSAGASERPSATRTSTHRTQAMPNRGTTPLSTRSCRGSTTAMRRTCPVPGWPRFASQWRACPDMERAPHGARLRRIVLSARGAPGALARGGWWRARPRSCVDSRATTRRVARHSCLRRGCHRRSRRVRCGPRSSQTSVPSSLLM